MKKVLQSLVVMGAMVPISLAAQERSSLITNDGAEISYWQAGSGKSLVMLPGWSQSANQFLGQMPLASQFQLTAVDHRGHGESSKVEHGFRIHRLAMDLHDVIEKEGLEDVTILGHSMGASVMWGYWDLFRSEHISRLVIVDQPATCAYNESWSESERSQAGGLWDYNALAATSDQIQSDEAVGFATDFVNNAFFTSNYPQDQKDIVTLENLLLPRPQAAHLIFNHCTIDWRDLIRSIDIPVLVVGGEKSIFDVSTLEWIKDAIPDAELEVFTEGEGGSHFMFMENPEKFNAMVSAFMTD